MYLTTCGGNAKQQQHQHQQQQQQQEQQRCNKGWRGVALLATTQLGVNVTCT
jgi:hypothetical protein